MEKQEEIVLERLQDRTGPIEGDRGRVLAKHYMEVGIGQDRLVVDGALKILAGAAPLKESQPSLRVFGGHSWDSSNHRSRVGSAGESAALRSTSYVASCGQGHRAERNRPRERPQGKCLTLCGWKSTRTPHRTLQNEQLSAGDWRGAG